MTCRFYGYSGIHGGILIPTRGNQCALVIFAHVSCQLPAPDETACPLIEAAATPDLFTIAERVTDDVLGAGEYERLNHFSAARMTDADRAERHLLSQHEPALAEIAVAYWRIRNRRGQQTQ